MIVGQINTIQHSCLADPAARYVSIRAKYAPTAATQQTTCDMIQYIGPF